MKIQSYKDLEVWKKAMNLVVECYKITQKFPKEELYSLTNQIRRSSVSVPSNIAEVQSRWSTKEFIRYLSIANGSLSEVETQLILAHRLNYISEETLKRNLHFANEIGRMINGLRKSLSKKL